MYCRACRTFLMQNSIPHQKCILHCLTPNVSFFIASNVSAYTSQLLLNRQSFVSHLKFPLLLSTVSPAERGLFLWKQLKLSKHSTEHMELLGLFCCVSKHVEGWATFSWFRGPNPPLTQLTFPV